MSIRCIDVTIVRLEGRTSIHFNECPKGVEGGMGTVIDGFRRWERIEYDIRGFLGDENKGFRDSYGSELKSFCLSPYIYDRVSLYL